EGPGGIRADARLQAHARPERDPQSGQGAVGASSSRKPQRPASGGRTARSRREKPWNAFRQDLLRLRGDTPDDLAGRWNIVNEAGVLSHGERGFVGITGFARGLHLRISRGLILAQRPFASGPARDEAIAARA